MQQTTRQHAWVYIGRSNKVQVYENESPKRMVIWGMLPHSLQAPAGQSITYHLSPNEWCYDPEAKAYVPLTEENRERLRHSQPDGQSLFFHEGLRVLKKISSLPAKPTVEEIAGALQKTRLLYRVESARDGSASALLLKLLGPAGGFRSRFNVR